MQLSLEWTKALSEEDAERLTKQVIEQYHLFEALQELINVKLQALAKQRIEDASFQLPAWSEYQASLIGREKTLQELKALITLRESSDHDR